MTRDDSLNITHARLLELVSYDPSSGEFTRLVMAAPNAMKGDLAGSYSSQGYVVVALDGRKYNRGRLAWFYVHGHWPNPEVDHINRVRDDDRIENLREASRTLNLINVGNRSDNTSGFRGVNWNSRVGKWRARLGHTELGHFTDIHDAADVVREARAAAIRAGGRP
jgi:hypothetical protein